MYTINRRNVNDNYREGLWHLKLSGTVEKSRNGQVIVAPGPVANVYYNPRERVLFDAVRDANPYFHFFESLWMLAGRQDVEYVAQFVKRMRDFSDDGVLLQGTYGYRWRKYFKYDQLNDAVVALQENPASRRVVIAMWGIDDSGKFSKDIPCNTHAYVSVRDSKLDLTVCCRSNDAIWGCYGANVVHFSFLQEYLACALSLEIGRYVQFSNNFHVYPDMPKFEEIWKLPSDEENLYQLTKEIVPGPLLFEFIQNHLDFYHTLSQWLEHPHNKTCYSFLNTVAYPMWQSFKAHKMSKSNSATNIAADIAAPDWRYACESWLHRRNK